MIAIIDYGAGNVFSVQNAFLQLNADVILTKDKNIIKNADKIVLPGVGDFKEAMENLKKSKLINSIYDVIDEKKPLLGICVGLQMMFTHSEEGNANGLGIFKGEIKKFPIELCKKVPQIGWNVVKHQEENKIFNKIATNSHFYFVHSYYLDAKDKKKVIGTTDYGIDFDSAYSKDNIYLTQFHPEKSGKIGLQLLENFVNL